MAYEPAKVRDLFHAAYELAPAERDPFLRSACQSDPLLYAEVARLFAAFARDNGQIEQLAEPLPDLPQKLGRYEVRRLIPGGRQAHILEAYDSVLQRTVAIKLIHRVPFHQSFDTEAKLLASLHHPGIVTIHGYETSADGRPYFVMPLIRGLPIDEYVKTTNCSLTRKLRLFGRVCAAVQYAHNQGVLHRDLKPSNILVDPEGHSHVLDFGIAAMIGQSESHYGAHGGTPGYAAPEQISGGPQTRRTDVYALGVLLFELLTQRPIEALHELDTGAVVKRGRKRTKVLSYIAYFGLIIFVTIGAASLCAYLQLGLETTRNVMMTVTSAATMAAVGLGAYILIKGDRNHPPATAPSIVHVLHERFGIHWYGAAIIAKCLQFEPRKRYKAVKSLRRDVLKWCRKVYPRAAIQIDPIIHVDYAP